MARRDALIFQHRKDGWKRERFSIDAHRFSCAITPLLAIFVNGLGMLLGGGEFDSRAEQVVYGFGLIALPTLAITGIWLSRVRPIIGLALTGIGVAGICIALFWMAFITVPIAVAIVAFSALRGGLIRLPTSRPRAA
jgi:hypothetical protein